MARLQSFTNRRRCVTATCLSGNLSGRVQGVDARRCPYEKKSSAWSTSRNSIRTFPSSPALDERRWPALPAIAFAGPGSAAIDPAPPSSPIRFLLEPRSASVHASPASRIKKVEIGFDDLLFTIRTDFFDDRDSTSIPRSRQISWAFNDNFRRKLGIMCTVIVGHLKKVPYQLFRARYIKGT